MVDPERTLALAATAYAIIVIPGPSVLFVISRGVTLGRRAGLATVVGNTAGLAVQLLGVVVGLGAMIERSIAAFTVVKLLGACYLVYLGVQAIRHRRSLTAALRGEIAPTPMRTIVREGFVVGVTNPKSIILFVAILPQFVDPSRGHVPVQILLLGLVVLTIALSSDSVWALAAGSARAWLGKRPERLTAIGGVGGLITVGLGVRLLFTGRRD